LISALLLFCSSFVLVTLLGLQTHFVRDRHVLTAFTTSACIGMCQLVTYKLAPDATFIESACFVSGGAFGIVFSMHIHKYISKFLHTSSK